MLASIQIVRGVKGYSPIHIIPTFNTFRCVPVDYMHAVLLGVSKKLATLWFNSNSRSKEWCVKYIYIRKSKHAK